MKEEIYGQHIWLKTINKGLHPLLCKRTAMWFRDLLNRQASINIVRNRELKNAEFLKENISSIKGLLAHVQDLNNKDTNGALDLCDIEDSLKAIVNNQQD
jgi:hypothetical protein